MFETKADDFELSIKNERQRLEELKPMVHLPIITQKEGFISRPSEPNLLMIA